MFLFSILFSVAQRISGKIVRLNENESFGHGFSNTEFNPISAHWTTKIYEEKNQIFFCSFRHQCFYNSLGICI